MIVYRTAFRSVRPSEVLKLACFDSHERIRRFLIHFGELEAALVDTICPTRDVVDARIVGLREISIATAKMFCAPEENTAKRLKSLLASVRLPDLPVEISVPEGYAYYGLFPETYTAAARQFFEAKRPNTVACIGIRSIGTSLSAVACAALEQLGCRVHSWTVRPHGHPFDRELRISTELENQWRALASAHFLIVDEGPGLSGSSFAAAAEAISKLGVPDERISFLPSWTPSGDAFISERARARWMRHHKYTSDPEPHGWVDLSAGKWRAIFYRDESEYPAVQTQHEARKFLCTSEAGTAFKKFAGLGLYGERKLDMARALTCKGFTPPAIGLEDGYLVSRFVSGQPLSGPARTPAPTQRASCDRDLLDAMARYLAFRREEFCVANAASVEDLRRMIEVNTGAPVDAPGDVRACISDGRMLPHEWIVTQNGYLKTDALDHGDNHFYPGPVDIAWDIAGAAVEFDLGPHAREYFIDAYIHASGDRRVRTRLVFYTTAYLAFRIGYASLNRLSGLEAWYRSMLEKEVGAAV